MKKVYYFLGAVVTILIIAIAIVTARKIENQTDNEYSYLRTDWEKTFETEQQALAGNYQLVADRTGYYDNDKIGDLIGTNREFENIRDRWDGLSIQAIIITDRNNMMFQETGGSSIGEVGWYAYGDNWELLTKNNFEIDLVIKGKNNWFYLRTKTIIKRQ